jgi:hypothetical protein
MQFYTKRTFFLLISVIGLSMLTSCKTKTPYNPYLSAKHKPSDKQRKEEQKQIKKGTKAWDEQMENNKKDIKAHRSFTTKQQYKRTTKIKRRKRSKKLNWRF